MGPGAYHLTPVDVVGLSSGVNTISSGGDHDCAVTDAGGAKCWGANFDGEVGDGTTIDPLTPVDVVGLTSGVTSILAGFLHTCALTVTGGVKCRAITTEVSLGTARTTSA